MAAGSVAVGKVSPQGWRKESTREQASAWEGRHTKCKLLESGLASVHGAPCRLFKDVWRCLSNREWFGTSSQRKFELSQPGP